MTARCALCRQPMHTVDVHHKNGRTTVVTVCGQCGTQHQLGQPATRDELAARRRRRTA